MIWIVMLTSSPLPCCLYRLLVVLGSHGCTADDSLWACLYCLTGLVRQLPYSCSVPAKKQASSFALRQALAGGGVPLLRRSLEAHQLRQIMGQDSVGRNSSAARSARVSDHPEAGGRRLGEGSDRGDGVVQDMIRGAGGFLGEVLRREQVEVREERRRQALAWGAAGTLVSVAALGCAWWWLGSGRSCNTAASLK